ncbi:hypothetical protein WCP94_000596 (plasmid) [Bilophila wadsworthia]
MVRASYGGVRNAMRKKSRKKHAAQLSILSYCAFLNEMAFKKNRTGISL